MTAGAAAQRERQASDAVLMVRPRHFGSNAETAASNFFQHSSSDTGELAERARREFDGLALALSIAGVRVHQFDGDRRAPLPDEVFPNNWLSLHADGTAVLYPLLAVSRRAERRKDILAALGEQCGYRIDRVVDLTRLEERGEYLEGTGSLVLDRERHIAYACRSPRTHAGALAEFARALDYEIVRFDAVDGARRPIYHTNIVLSLGTRFAALCARAVEDGAERSALCERLEGSGRELIALRPEELESFAGNVLELSSGHGPVIALSERALGSLRPATRQAFERHGALVAACIDTIEHVGGGSVRCMLAEIALPRRVSPALDETSRPRSPRS
jgi:hypothetical protein